MTRVPHTQAILTPDLADQFIIRAIWVPCESVPSVCGLGGPARDPGFPVLALRQGLIQSSFHLCRSKNATPMEPDTAHLVVCIVAGNTNSQVSLVWSWHLFRRICLTSGNRGTAGVGDSVVLRRSWTWPKSVWLSIERQLVALSSLSCWAAPRTCYSRRQW